MHILVTTGIFHPEAGGPSTYLRRLLPELQAQGHTVEVITFSDDTPPDDYGYPIWRVRRTTLAHRYWTYFQAVKTRLPSADLVFINSLGLPLPRIYAPKLIKIVGDLAWERAMNRGWLPTSTDIDVFQTTRYGPLVNRLKHSRSHESQQMDRIIVPSQYLKRMVMGWGVPEDRIQIVYNAYEPQLIETITEGDNYKTDFILLSVSRLVPWKGIPYILEAMASYPKLTLRIVGDGPIRETWQADANARNLADRVQFLGQLPHQEVIKQYQAADYTILYSGYEGLSHVLLESLNVGTPIIASDKGGNPELVQHGVNGFLVPYPDVVALQQTLDTALDHTTLQKLRRTTSLDASRFAWDRLIQDTLDIIEAVGRG
jgi:glycosyltransferase involved in cell wall biosynthesis